MYKQSYGQRKRTNSLTQDLLISPFSKTISPIQILEKQQKTSNCSFVSTQIAKEQQDLSN